MLSHHHLQLDDLLGGVFVDDSVDILRFFDLAAQQQNSWRLGEPVKQNSLDDGGDKTEGD